MKYNTMGEMIAALRKEKGMTQQELADKMGVTDKAVSKWERNISCPDVAVLPRLAELFGITVDELMNSEPKKTEAPKEDVRAIIAMILKAMPVAMGVAVAVLSVINQIQIDSALTLLGIGLACSGLASLQESK